jgi:hypothetical protein
MIAHAARYTAAPSSSKVLERVSRLTEKLRAMTRSLTDRERSKPDPLILTSDLPGLNSVIERYDFPLRFRR